MPYIQQSTIDSFHWLNNIDSNRMEYSRLLDSPRETFNVPLMVDGYEMIKVVESGSLFTIALLYHEKEKVLYYIKCEVWEHLNLGKPVTQLKLWRTTDSRYQAVTSGLPSKVFAKLLDEYNVVASDGVHTYSGKRFWQQELSRAINTGLLVYRVDTITDQIEQITNVDKIADNSVDLWGSDEKYMSILAVISKGELV